MASEQFSLCWDNFHKNMSSGMNSLLENEDLVDVTLAVEGKCLKAHKMVLSVCSPYFKELFKSNPCQHPIVFMKDVSYVALSDLLQFMYQGEVQVSQENLTTFIKTAEALQIKGLTGDGNGSADTEPVEAASHEKPVHQIEEYKPVSRPKKQAAPVTTQSPSVKRPRLSVSSSDSQPLPPTVTKTEPAVSTPSAGGTEPPVQFKMEPYDQSQSLIDETGDENFGDDTLDDANADDTEDYAMMEGGVGEEEPQAGTSTDGAGEGQEDEVLQKNALKRLPQNGIVVGGFTYHQNTTKKISKMRYLVCSEYKRLICKARAVLPAGASVENLILRKEHNHPPYHEACVRDIFIREIKHCIVNQPSRPLRQLYEDVSEMDNLGDESEDGNIEHVPDEIEEWKVGCEPSLPLKSRARYQQTYVTFQEWLNERNLNISEMNILAYFIERSEKLKSPGSLWSEYSMLKSTINLNNNINIGEFQKLLYFLKKKNAGHQVKKSKVFTREEMNRFLMEAPDDCYLMMKVVMILGIAGACRREELTNLTIDNVEDKGTVVIVNLPNAETNVCRMFTITDRCNEEGKLLEFFRKYVNLRPTNATSRRFFYAYRQGKCVNQPVGINTMGKVPRMIARYLNLKEPHLYTGHSFRRTSATLLANMGVNIMGLKRPSRNLHRSFFTT